MLHHALLSGVLLLFPVVVTVGIYIGVESQRIFGGGFKGGYGVPKDLAEGTRIETNRYCQKAFGVTPSPGRYTFNPNQWALTAEEASSLCMNVTTDSKTPDSSLAAAAFDVTWQYPQGPVTMPVHAFPNVKLDVKDSLPLQVSDLSSLKVNVAWSYNGGNEASNTTDAASLAVAGMNANVAVDMFLGADAAKSGSTTESQYEVMVWLGRFGASTQPIGLPLGSKDAFAINGTRFDLYFGSNDFGQTVFTWVAAQNATRFSGDIAPLITRLSKNGGPTTADHLGYVAFGSEAYYSLSNVTFYVPKLELNVLSR